MNLRLKIALTLLTARLRQSVVAAAGVTFGITAFITLVSFMTGLNKLMDDFVTNRTPHIRLYNEIRPSTPQPINLLLGSYKNFISSIRPENRGKEIYNSQKIIAAVKADERVIDAAPKITSSVFFNKGSIEMGGIVNGIDVLAEEKMFSLSKNVIKGSIEDLSLDRNNIFIGKGLADKLMVTMGDNIQVTTVRGDRAILKVAGIIQFGLAEVDDVQSYTSIQTAQILQGKASNYVTDIQVKLKDIKLAPSISKEYAGLFNVDALDVRTANAQFETGTNVRNVISYSVSITLLIVAGFGIYNILNMLIYEKMDTIAILKATGFSGSDVKMIFIMLSMIIGIAGGCLGLGLGYILSTIISHIPFETEALPTIKTYPVSFKPIFYFVGISFALVTTYIAGLFPALKAAKVDPVVIIRGK